MPDITKTRAQLREQAATELGIIGSGQSLSAEDADTLDNYIDPLVLDLSIRGIVYIGDTDAVESEFFLPLAKLLGNEAAVSFGKQRNDGLREFEEERLRVLTQRRDRPTTFLQVDRALRAGGTPLSLTRWQSGDF